MKFAVKILLTCWLSIFCFSRLVFALDISQPTGFVNDFAGLLSSSFIQQLETELQNFEKETGAEIAVVTVPDLQGTTVEDFAVRLFEKWGIGKKDQDNGILVLVAKQEKKIRLEVGYGLEPVITDGRAGRIIREQMQTSFRKEDYESGIKAAVVKIEDYIRTGEVPTSNEVSSDKVKNSIVWIIFGIVFLSYLSAFLGRSKRIWPGAVVGGILGSFLGLLQGGFIWTVLGFALLGLFLDYLLSKNYQQRKKSHKPTSFWRSWGGFSGGSSGGGGASGGW